MSIEVKNTSEASLKGPISCKINFTNCQEESVSSLLVNSAESPFFTTSAGVYSAVL